MEESPANTAAVLEWPTLIGWPLLSRGARLADRRKWGILNPCARTNESPLPSVRPDSISFVQNNALIFGLGNALIQAPQATKVTRFSLKLGPVRPKTVCAQDRLA